MSDMKNLNWADRFALIDNYTPSDEAICSAFNVEPDELTVARNLRSNGNFAGKSDINIAEYSKVFSGKTMAKPTGKLVGTPITPRVKPNRAKGDTSHTMSALAGESTTAATATKVVIPPKKRGRKGNKMELAFRAITATAVPAEQFATDNGVSIAILRQSKRFDNYNIGGSVRVKKDKETKQLMIWREADAS